MSHVELDPPEPTPGGETPATAAAVRKRPKPGERRVQILQALAAMLEQPGGERITTAALAARLEVSEAALYRHFASKAQMFEGLIEFIEQSVFTLINQIAEREPAGPAQAGRIVAMLIQFASLAIAARSHRDWLPGVDSMVMTSASSSTSTTVPNMPEPVITSCPGARVARKFWASRCCLRVRLVMRNIAPAARARMRMKLISMTESRVLFCAGSARSLGVRARFTNEPSRRGVPPARVRPF